jgi:hypothetical protein
LIASRCGSDESYLYLYDRKISNTTTMTTTAAAAAAAAAGDRDGRRDWT